MEKLNGYEVLNSEVLRSFGCFSVTRLHVRGWHADLAKLGSVRFKDGWSGKETELLIEAIRPQVIFEVKDTMES